MGRTENVIGNLMVLFTFRLAVLVCFVALFVSSEYTQNEDGTGTISFKPPSLSDEEAHNPHMPSALKCDGCKIIAYQISKALKAAHGEKPTTKHLSESVIIDILESVCNGEYKEYGIKQVDGVKRLSGPGLDTEKTPGVLQGGGLWPNRLREMCNEYVGELEEDEIYQAYIDYHEDFETYLCKGPGIRGKCYQPKKAKHTEL